MSQSASTSREARFLLCCARNSADPKLADNINRLAGSGINWQRLVWMADIHKVTPLVYASLRRTCKNVVPCVVLAELEQRMYRTAAYNLFLTDELLSILSLFRAAEIRALPFKGPILAATVYQNLGLREFGDLDVLVRRRDIPKVCEAMTSHGYQLAPRYERALGGPFPAAEHHYTFVKEEEHISIVEIHAEIAPWYFSVRFSTDDLLARAIPASLASATVLTLCSEDLLLVLCAHGTEHAWKYLELVCSVAELLRGETKFQWEWVIAEAQRLGIQRMLWVGLLLARNLLGAPCDSALRDQMDKDAAAHALARRIQERLFSTGSGMKELLRVPWFHLRARERPRDRLSYALRVLAAPELHDFVASQLPNGLAPITPAIRIVHALRHRGAVALDGASLKSAPRR